MSLVRSRSARKPHRSSQDPQPYFVRQVSGTITATADATPHTKGAWIEVVSATTHATTLIEMWADVDVSGAATGTLVDIGIGGAGSEVVVVPNIPIGSWINAANTQRNASIALPLSIPTGARVAVRIQSVVVSHTAAITIGFSGGGALIPAPTAEIIGSDTATSRGVYVGGVATYVQITAGTASHYRYLVMVPSASNTALPNLTASFDLGVGPAASEVALGRIWVDSTTIEAIGVGARLPVWAMSAITPGAPAGSRLAVKPSSGSNALDFALIGIPY